MKISFLFFTTFLFAQVVWAQFNFRQHKIVAGEDVYSIAKEYNTTPEQIFRLNPNAKAGIKPGEKLVIPNVVEIPELPVEGVEFINHKVKKKQTLYSLSKMYKVSIQEIKKYNDFLESNPLKKGDILKIPQPAPKVTKVFKSLNDAKDGEVKKEAKLETEAIQREAGITQIYTVKPKETRYGIARKFGITITDLEAMNPNLGVSFPVGIEILVPKQEAENLQPVAKDGFILYRVPKKQTMYSLSKEFHISTDSILALNPELKDGLKSDMVIQMPKNDYKSSLKTLDLEQNLINLSPKKIAILLPFNVEDLGNDKSDYDDYLQKSKVARLVVDFYSGALLALDKAKKLGVDIVVDVLDTQKSGIKLQQYIDTGNLETYHAIIGPLYNKNVEKLATSLKNTPSAIFSPMSNKVKFSSSNLYQTLPNSEELQNRIIKYVARDTIAKNIIVIADTKNSVSKKKLLQMFPKAKVLKPVDDTFIVEEELLKLIGEEKSEIPNYFFLESSNLLLVSNVTSLLNARAKSHKITLFTTDKTNVYDNESISNENLSNLNFHYPSANKIVDGTDDLFLVNYKSKYGLSPNSYAVRGYDLTYDVILRLCASNQISDLNTLNLETEHLENKFKYILNKDGGIVNQASYIVKYAPGLKFEVVE